MSRKTVKLTASVPADVPDEVVADYCISAITAWNIRQHAGSAIPSGIALLKVKIGGVEYGLDGPAEG